MTKAKFWAVERKDSGSLTTFAGWGEGAGPLLFGTRALALVYIDRIITKHIEGQGPRFYYRPVRMEVRRTQERR